METTTTKTKRERKNEINKKYYRENKQKILEKAKTKQKNLLLELRILRFGLVLLSIVHLVVSLYRYFYD